ncbi:MAG: argininosuccinate synthase [Euryarchaeota archaeon]|nr:argininosuccinate synthase [Euryarchaeota archaeon]MDE1835304.1 argininosuccinate synthase [Euryarchaeota archaeon]MDE1880575.1 argininosuccinate synthase [Euryarchaeota archaeon]MDE2043600.1 argininosuccinate synthase [Thermoplasmata archaeon]
MAGKLKHVVLAYSGGLDTSVAIPWIKEHYGAEVTTLTVDVGQEGELEDAVERAPINGAREAFLEDAKVTFAEEFLFPALQANCLYQGVYPLSTSLARPLIVRHLVSAALRLGADAVAHGCTGKGNDQVRFDVGVQTLAPHLSIIAPVREWNMNRQDEIAYAREHGLKIHVKPESPYSVDENLWGRSVEGGRLEDPGSAPPEEVFQWTSHPEKWPKVPEDVVVGFSRGAPISLNGRSLEPVDLIQTLNQKAGAHGIGRIDHVEDRVVGIKSRETYECPAAIALVQAHQALEALVLPRDLLSFKGLVDRRFADTVYEGMWYSPLRESLSSFVASTQETVTGQVTLRLFQGTSRVVGRRSPFSLLSHELATYDRTSTFRQEAAEGFIHLFGLANRLAYARRREALTDAEEREALPASGKVSPPTPP